MKLTFGIALTAFQALKSAVETDLTRAVIALNDKFVPIMEQAKDAPDTGDTPLKIATSLGQQKIVARLMACAK